MKDVEEARDDEAATANEAFLKSTVAYPLHAPKPRIQHLLPSPTTLKLRLILFISVWKKLLYAP